MACEFVSFLKAVFFLIELFIDVFTMPKLVIASLMIKN